MNLLSPSDVVGRVGLVGTLAVVSMFGLATACGPQSPVSPLPLEMPSVAISSSAAGAITSSSAQPSASTARPARRTPSASPACMGPVTFTVDASEGGPPWSAYCVAVGALLRLENHGPEGVSVDPPEKVACVYEAGVRECRFLEPGTIRFTIVRETETRTLTVVVVG